MVSKRGSDRTRALVALGWTAALAMLPVAAEKPPRRWLDGRFDVSLLSTFDLEYPVSNLEAGVVGDRVAHQFVALVVELMTAKGYRRDLHQPDFLIRSDNLLTPGYRWASGRIDVEDAVGLLVLRTNEPGDEDPFWIASAKGAVRGDATPEKVWKSTERATRRILATFPAKNAAEP